MKVVIIGGGGTVGSSVAYCLSRRNIVDEVVLIDTKENMTQSHAMDIEIAITGTSCTNVRAGSWAELENASLVIVTAGLPERQVVSRNEFLDGNRVIIKNIAEQIKCYCPQAIVITASNPVDVLNYEMYAASGGSSQKIIGFSQNDTTRFIWALAKVLKVEAASISALAIGEHGEKQVFLFDSILINGKPVSLNDSQQKDVRDLVENWFASYQKLNSMRSSGWTSGENITNLVDAIIKNSDQAFVCSTVLHGEYNEEDISIGVPVKLGSDGIKEIVQLPLSLKEKQEFREAAKKIQKLINI